MSCLALGANRDDGSDGVEIADIVLLDLQLDGAGPGAPFRSGWRVHVIEQAAVAIRLRLIARRPFLPAPFELQPQVVIPVRDCFVRSSPNASPEIRIAGRPSTSPATVNTSSGSRPLPIASVYLPSAPRARPGTSDVGSGRWIQVVQPSRFEPFQSGIQPGCARIVITPHRQSITPTSRTLTARMADLSGCRVIGGAPAVFVALRAGRRTGHYGRRGKEVNAPAGPRTTSGSASPRRAGARIPASRRWSGSSKSYRRGGRPGST